MNFFLKHFIGFVPKGMKVCIGARFGYNIFHLDVTQYVSDMGEYYVCILWMGMHVSYYG
jgi:hypothetical protein